MIHWTGKLFPMDRWQTWLYQSKVLILAVSWLRLKRMKGPSRSWISLQFVWHRILTLGLFPKNFKLCCQLERHWPLNASTRLSFSSLTLRPLHGGLGLRLNLVHADWLLRVQNTCQNPGSLLCLSQCPPHRIIKESRKMWESVFLRL